ncbi:MAG: hypothetical protein EOR77_21670 [Mesorhizobium sp.]|uniref:hypothetical protein n=1 Tax=Mesorhizobium sp. TaxID=1871066 RepID=UPI000FE8C610|nr:hypothetical protein [Mesorhizobium sp.]RWH86460.1 MAG: hypothetical protein EOQ87_26575 [Mesorhizobium sp.]RWM32284.1 MAG: hypothetical protein EOR77_21670 [Mesorhizobium sp.]TJV33784.1 MAG: hypothetical protein E5X87_10650 [Mesorhizobium sp.]
MMLGTLAQRGAPAQGTPAWVPAGADGFLGFVTGQYFSGGAERAIATLLGGDFDPAAISASGMRITPSNGNRPKAIGALLSDLTAGLAAGCTILFDINSAISPSGFLIFIGDDINFDLADEAIIANANGALFDYWDLDVSDAISGSGLHKIAVTLARSVGGGNHEYAWCDDGGAAVTQTVNYLTHVSPVDTILFGHDGVGTGNSLNDIYIRSITLYPAKLPAELTALTAL